MNINPAYLAGVIDSDGSFSISRLHKKRRNVSYSPSFQLTWSNTLLTREFFEQLKIQYGGSYFVGMPSSKNSFPNAKQIIKYCLVCRQIRKLIVDVLPFLILKRRQARTLLRLLNNTYKGRCKPERLSKFQEILWKKNKEYSTKNKASTC